jgi:hypothetical protein
MYLGEKEQGKDRNESSFLSMFGVKTKKEDEEEIK